MRNIAKAQADSKAAEEAARLIFVDSDLDEVIDILERRDEWALFALLRHKAGSSVSNDIIIEVIRILFAIIDYELKPGSSIGSFEVGVFTAMIIKAVKGTDWPEHIKQQPTWLA